MVKTNKKFCEEYGISMTELARRAKVNRSVLYDIDANRYKSRKSFKIEYAKKRIAREATNKRIEDNLVNKPIPRKEFNEAVKQYHDSIDYQSRVIIRKDLCINRLWVVIAIEFIIIYIRLVFY